MIWPFSYFKTYLLTYSHCLFLLLLNNIFIHLNIYKSLCNLLFRCVFFIHCMYREPELWLILHHCWDETATVSDVYVNRAVIYITLMKTIRNTKWCIFLASFKDALTFSWALVIFFCTLLAIFPAETPFPIGNSAILILLLLFAGNVSDVHLLRYLIYQQIVIFIKF